MDWTEYQKEAFKTNANLGEGRIDDYHMLFGMVTEVGEMIDAYKKEMAYGKKLDLVNVKEELGDLMWYIAGFCTFNDIDLEEVMGTNIAKLKERYPLQFSKEKALHRNLEAEREILESE